MKLLIAVDSAEQALFRDAGVPFDHEIGAGEPAQALVEMAGRHHCDGIVMVARGLGGAGKALLGSVSHGVLHGSKLPVTVDMQRGQVGRPS